MQKAHPTVARTRPAIHAAAFTTSTLLLAAALAGCTLRSTGSGGGDAGTTSAASGTAATVASAEPPKPPPPADAPKSCGVTLTGKVLDSSGQPSVEYKIKNTGSHPWHYCQIYVFAFDKSGTRVGAGSMSENVALKPGEERTPGFGISVNDDKSQTVIRTPGLSYEVQTTSVYFDDRSEWEDKSFSFFDHKKATAPLIALGAAPATATTVAKGAPPPKKK